MLTAPSRDWGVFQQIFADHWEIFQHAHPRYQTPYYDGLVAKMLACGQPEKMGYVEYRCFAVWPGHAPGGHELQIGAVLTVRQSPCRQLGEPGEPGPPCGGHLSAYHPDGPGDVPHALLPERGGRIKCVHALWGAMPG